MSPSPRPVRTHISQGEFAVGSAAEPTVITTILGSCVATCLWDDEAGIGGMNHMVLPGEAGAGALRPESIGAYAMEVLLNGLLKAGACKSRLRAKLFGGGRMIAGLSDVGARNVEFARNFLLIEGIPHLGGCVGGSRARRVDFTPSTGEVRQRLLQDEGTAGIWVRPRPPSVTGPDAVELF